MRLRPFFTASIYYSKTNRTFLKISQTLEAFQERSGPVNEQERLGMFESELSNALERIVKNGHGKFTVLSRSPIKNERITVGKF